MGITTNNILSPVAFVFGILKSILVFQFIHDFNCRVMHDSKRAMFLNRRYLSYILVLECVLFCFKPLSELRLCWSIENNHAEQFFILLFIYNLTCGKSSVTIYKINLSFFIVRNPNHRKKFIIVPIFNKIIQFPRCTNLCLISRINSHQSNRDRYDSYFHSHSTSIGKSSSKFVCIHHNFISLFFLFYVILLLSCSSSCHDAISFAFRSC